MSPLAPVYIAICGLAAATSAFVIHPRIVASPFRHAAFAEYRRPSHLGSMRQDASQTSEKKFQDDKQGDNLNQERFLEELDRSLSAPDTLPSTSSSLAWKFRGHDIFCQVSLPETERRPATTPAILLIHGFGCSTVYWRETVRVLTEAGFTVHAIDLLGQGMSAKPSDGVEYSINLWAQQADAYARENMAGEEIVLLGNSVGSLVALTAATGDFAEDGCEKCYIRQHIAGIGMFNCGIGLNIRNMVKDPKWNPAQKFLLNLTFDILESYVFGNLALMTWLLDKVVTKDMLRNTLTELYKCAPQNVDDELVDSFYAPAKQAGSAEVLCQILTNNAGLTPIELHAKHETFLNNLPIHLCWGDEDTVVPLKWQVGQFYSNSALENDSAVTMDVVHGGHILFDEVPDVSNGSMLRWLDSALVINNALEQEPS